jgi:CRISPR-associated protein Cas2
MAGNGWRIMWIVALYDCPMLTPQERHDYNVFHKLLLREGFCRHQLSVYVRHCPTFAHAEALAAGLKDEIPDAAKVTFFFLTDKQFGMTRVFTGPKHEENRPNAPEQFELF